MSEPINFLQHRAAKQQATGEEAHAKGEAFAFAPYVYEDDGFGRIATGEVVVVLDHERLTGIRMSRMDAVRFASAVLETALFEEGPAAGFLG
jgi:hypothetical protein